MNRTTMMMSGAIVVALGAAHHAPAAEAEASGKGAAEAVRAYVKAGDRRDVAACERVTHPAFRVVFTQGTAGEVALMSKADYLGLMKAEKIGGVPRTVDIRWSRPTGNIAYVKATLRSDGAEFDSLYTLVKTKGRWLLVQDAVRFDPRAS